MDASRWSAVGLLVFTASCVGSEPPPAPDAAARVTAPADAYTKDYCIPSRAISVAPDDLVLEDGAVPLWVLHEKVERWMGEKGGR